MAETSMLVLAAIIAAALVIAMRLRGAARAVPRNEPGLARLHQQRLAKWQAARASAYVISALMVFGAGSIYLQGVPWHSKTLAQIALAGGFSAVVGFGELVSRYKDDPLHLAGSPATVVYLTVNGAAGIAAFALVQEFDVFGHDTTASTHKAVYEVLLASFGAIAFFRTSLFTARVGDADVGIGPSTLLQALLNASDLLLDRGQAENRAAVVGRIMKNISFEKARISLPTLCLALVEGLSQEQQRLIGEQVAKLIDDKNPLPAENKSTILGVYLLRQVGASVLESAIETLGAQIQLAGPGGQPPSAPADA